MATAQEKQDIGQLKTDVAVLKNDMKYVKSDLKKVVDFLDSNKPGIRTASLLDNKIVTIFISAIIVAGVYFLGKAGGGF